MEIDVKTIAEIKEALLTQHRELTEFVKKANGEIEVAGKASAETKAAIEKMAEEAKTLGDRLFQLEKDKQTAKASETKTAGQVMVESDQWKAMMSNRRGTARVEVKAIVNATGQNQPLVPAMRVPGIITEPNRILTIRDLLLVGRTNSNLIEYAKENVFTNNAGPQVGHSPTEYENVTKPESNITFTLESMAVQTIAHWIPASKQVLADSPMLQSYIDGRLSYGLKLEEEDQLLNGNGANGNLSGLLKAGNYTAYNRGATADTKIDTIRKAFTQCALSNYTASAVVMNPADWEEIELAKDTQGRYIFANPQQAAMPMMWGRPVVPTNSIAAGTFLTGAFNMAAQIWDREDASVSVSTENSDNFVKNMVTILAEERLALTVYRPAGMISGSF
jgi:HK97 family phage major capsid protein